VDIRVAAYAIIADQRGLLLAHWRQEQHSGWTLPGGGLDPGEHPAAAAVREVTEETGYHVELDELLGIDSIVIAAEDRLHSREVPQHSLRIVYRAHVVGGSLRHEQGGTTDQAAWFSLPQVAELQRVSLVDAGLRLAGL
jgi:ADP-ribose pyrophosphatase YjhB (NUDIX family)